MAVELGVWRGEFAEQNLKIWRGNMYVLVDLWTPSDCVNGNQQRRQLSAAAAERSFDKMVTGLRMKRTRKAPDGSDRYRMLRLDGRGAHFADGTFDWIYLDATHTYAEAKRDLATWYPKVDGRRATINFAYWRWPRMPSTSLLPSAI